MRLLYGNGLRAEIWQPFVDRFRVKIGELYGSTEGTSSLGETHFTSSSTHPISVAQHVSRPLNGSRLSEEMERSAGGSSCIDCAYALLEGTDVACSEHRRSRGCLRFLAHLSPHEEDAPRASCEGG